MNKDSIGTIGMRNVWQPWVLHQNTIWVNIEGEVIPLAFIGARYALNILKWVWREHPLSVPVEENGGPLIVALTKIVKRGTGLYENEIRTLVREQPDKPAIKVYSRWFDDDDWMADN